MLCVKKSSEEDSTHGALAALMPRSRQIASSAVLAAPLTDSTSCNSANQQSTLVQVRRAVEDLKHELHQSQLAFQNPRPPTILNNVSDKTFLLPGQEVPHLPCLRCRGSDPLALSVVSARFLRCSASSLDLPFALLLWGTHGSP